MASRRPEIFVSATTADLRTCRQLVRDGLLILGCLPVTQDHFPPDSRTIREMLREKIGACDAVIHIAGECFGAEPKQRDPAEPRRSYTQLEYDVARELKKPLYTFVCSTDFNYDPHSPEPDELRQLQNRHREAISQRDELYVPIANSHELEKRVRELQARIEHLAKDLAKTRSWLVRGVAAAIIVLSVVGFAVWMLYARTASETAKKAVYERYVWQIAQTANEWKAPPGLNGKEAGLERAKAIIHLAKQRHAWKIAADWYFQYVKGLENLASAYPDRAPHVKAIMPVVMDEYAEMLDASGQHERATEIRSKAAKLKEHPSDPTSPD